ncbi:uncharacterized protein LOC103312579 [Tribolium castaneum]|uniref:uncharacterized protein LOC103312579 n=1 Tax=Tribolium castaneum TaxID=7070 RepID=UPI0030FF0508
MHMFAPEQPTDSTQFIAKFEDNPGVFGRFSRFPVVAAPNPAKCSGKCGKFGPETRENFGNCGVPSPEWNPHLLMEPQVWWPLVCSKHHLASFVYNEPKTASSSSK